MSRKVLKSVKIYADTHKEVLRISKASNTNIHDILSHIIDSYISNGFEFKAGENQKLLKVNFLEEVQKLLDESAKDLKKSFIERTNTSIGFIKTLDRKVEMTRKDVLFKIDPDDDPLFHPLEIHYDFMIKTLLQLLKVNGIGQEDLIEKLKPIISRDEQEFFIRSFNVVSSKKIN